MIKSPILFTLALIFQFFFTISLVNARGMIDKIHAPDYLDYTQEQKIHWIDQFGHYESVNAVAFSRDDKYMVSGDYTGLIILRHLTSGKIVSRFQAEANISSIAFTQDGLHIVSRDGNNLSLWSLDGRLIKSLNTKQADIYNTDLTTYGRYIMLEDLNHNITLLETNTLERVETIPALAEDEEYVALSPSGTFVVGKKTDTSIRLWKINDSTLLSQIDSSTPAFEQIKISTEGILASRGQDKSVYLWNTDGNLLHELADHQYKVTDIYFSADGKYLITEMSNIIKIWQVANGKLISELSPTEWNINTVAFSFNNKKMAVAHGFHIILWDMQSQKEIKRFTDQSYFISRALFSRGNKQLVLGYAKYFFEGGGQCNLFNTEQREVLNFKVPGLHNITDVALSTDGTFLASTGSLGRDPRFMGELTLWDMDGSAQIIKVPYTDWLYSLVITADSQYLATMGDDSQIKLWNRDGQIIRVFPAGERTYAMDMSPNDRYIAAITERGLTLWDFDGSLYKVLGQGGLFCFAPEQSLIACRESNSKMVLYDYEEGTIIHEFIYQEADGDITSFSFSEDGKYLVVLYGAVGWEIDAHKIDIIDTLTGEKTKTIQFSPEINIQKVELGVNNNFLIIVTNDHFVKILNLSTQKALFISNFDDGHWVVHDEECHFDCSLNGQHHVGLIKGINPLPITAHEDLYRPGLLNQFFRGE